MAMEYEALVTRVAGAVLASAKYADLCPEIVMNVARREVAKLPPAQREGKVAIKATKNKLHQIAGAYFATGADEAARYPGWLEALRAARDEPARLKTACGQIMEYHASTRERLPDLENWATAVFAEIGVVHSVLDLACGLNPLIIPWLDLAPDATYRACDLYRPMMAFIGSWLDIAGIDGNGATVDLTQPLPGEWTSAQVAFLLKLIPCLDQLDHGASARLLDALDVEHLVISFPARSLGGHERGMARNYEARLNELMAGRQRKIRRVAFATEVVYIATREGNSRGLQV